MNCLAQKLFEAIRGAPLKDSLFVIFCGQPELFRRNGPRKNQKQDIPIPLIRVRSRLDSVHLNVRLLPETVDPALGGLLTLEL